MYSPNKNAIGPCGRPRNTDGQQDDTGNCGVEGRVEVEWLSVDAQASHGFRQMSYRGSRPGLQPSGDDGVFVWSEDLNL
jgi:hypothetical protein